MDLGKKISGGKYIKPRKRKAREIAGQKRVLKLGEEKRKIKRATGGLKKTALLTAKYVIIQTHGKSKKVEIKNVVETPSNRFLARQNIITKGTIITTDQGDVKITSRPSQSGVLNGVLIKKD